MKDLGVDEKIILKCILENRVLRCVLDSCGLGQGQWCSLVNMVMNLWVL
jgi:hypothetical protein